MPSTPSWYEPEHPLWGAFVEWACITGHDDERFWRAWESSYTATLRKLEKALDTCPARHEADRRLKEGE